MNDLAADAIHALALMFEQKHAEAMSNGATHEQAIEVCRALWTDYLLRTR